MITSPRCPLSGPGAPLCVPQAGLFSLWWPFLGGCDVRFLGQIAPTASPTALLREDALSIPTTARLCEAVGVAGGIMDWKRVGQRRA